MPKRVCDRLRLLVFGPPKPLKPRLYRGTGETCHALHIRLWTWLAQNPRKPKHAWPEWDSNGGKIPRADADCFACQYGCNRCPLSWPEIVDPGKAACVNIGTLYKQWIWCNSDEEQVVVAAQIAAMEWTER